jgi:hypothetical protein
MSPQRKFLRGCLAVCMAACLLSSVPVSAQTSPKEYEIKAAFIYRLTQFMEWPTNRFESSKEPILLCIAGKDPFGQAIDTVLKDQKIGERDIHIKRMETAGSSTHTNCHLLFLGASLGTEAEKIVTNLQPHAILTIGEEEDFTRKGGHIRLYLQENKLRFEVNIAALERSGLKLHSQVMKLATRITRDGKDVKK